VVAGDGETAARGVGVQGRGGGSTECQGVTEKGF
jgi:hypothetical protein